MPLRAIEPETSGHLMKPREEAGKRGEPVIEVDRITKQFTLRAGGPFSAPKLLKALDCVSFTVNRGECLGVVGESGSGKTTTAMAILKAIGIDSGAVRYALNGTMASLCRVKVDKIKKKKQLHVQSVSCKLNGENTFLVISAAAVRAAGQNDYPVFMALRR